MTDTLVFNTCAVTAEAVRQARQAIRKARRERPEARLVVTGCAAQIDPAAFAAMPEVDLVLGNAEKTAPGAYAGAISARVRVGDIFSVRETDPGTWRRPARAGAGLCRGPERLRSPLHLLCHSLRPGQFPLGWRRRCGRAGPAPGVPGL